MGVQFYCSDLNESLAIECAGKIWHLCDWYFEEHKESLDYNQLSVLQGEVGKECFSLRVMRDVCNGSKHASLEKTRTPVIRKANKRKGGFSSDFSRGFNITVLQIELADGTEAYFEDAVNESMKYWKNKLKP